MHLYKLREYNDANVTGTCYVRMLQLLAYMLLLHALYRKTHTEYRFILVTFLTVDCRHCLCDICVTVQVLLSHLCSHMNKVIVYCCTTGSSLL